MNTVFEYLYRDASNNKKWGEVIFTEETSVARRQRLVSALHDGEWFIAEHVRLPDLFLHEFPTNEDDHCWHEFHSLSATDVESNDAHARTIEECVREFETAPRTGWREFARVV